MNNRPRLKIKLTLLDKIIELVGLITLILFWIYTIYHYSSLPEIIPIHYNGAGEADGFGDKINIFSLPVVATVLFIGTTILNQYSHLFNYTSTLTEENAPRLYQNATRLLRYLKTITVIIFGLIAYSTIQNTHTNTEGLGSWFLLFTLAVIFIPIIVYLAVNE